MGDVVQFTQTTQCQLDKALSVIFDKISAIAVGNAKIEEDIRVIEATLLNTQNSDVRALGLQQLRAIHARLKLVSNDMLKAKCLLLGYDATMGVTDLKISNSNV
jgi:hypothetical protein